MCNVIERQRGDILQARDRSVNSGLHYIIFYDGYDESEFVGSMLTSSSKYEENIEFKEFHFIKEDQDGNNFKITCNNSRFVPVKLYKPEEWGPYKLVGKLSKEGVAFVDEHIAQTAPVYWREYIK